MKTLFKAFFVLTVIVSPVVFLSGCDDEVTGPQLTGESKEYTLASVSDPSISGTVTFEERDDDQIVVTIQLEGTQSGQTHPAHIHANSAAQGGPIVLDLNAVSGADGKSETIVSAWNDGAPLTYADLLDFDGYVNVHKSEADLGTLVAQGDIGANELTGDSKVYEMTPVADPNVSGTVTFEKRKKGTTLVTVALEGTQPGASHASHFHTNSIAQGGSIIINLKNVDGTTGMAKTSVDTMNNGTPITYEELLNINAYINVHVGSSFVAQADVGQNELTGDHQHYALNEVDGSGISGEVRFEKRKNGKALVTIAVTGTTAGADHPAHIHVGNVASGGGAIVLDLKNVIGATGLSATSANALKDGTEISYDELVAFDGHVNVHKSAAELAILVAQGDIGSNAN